VAHNGKLRQSRADEVYHALREAILSGELAPHERLVEQTIAVETKVSRTPVRQALQRLEMDGLVESRGRSVVVVDPSSEGLSELCVVRENLEGLAARLAAHAHSDIDLGTLERLLEQSESAVDAGDVEALVDLNHAFHELIWASARNRYLARQLDLIRALIERRQSTTLSDPDRRIAAQAEHRAILAAIAARDPQAAEEAARLHFRHALALRMLNAHLPSRVD
jgi:DNA-binding GntR family transcriptional regulator